MTETLFNIRRRWYRCSLRTMLAAAAGLALAGWLAFAAVQGFVAYDREQTRRIEKRELECYMLDGTIDPDSQMGKGLFTAQEIESIKTEGNRLKSLPSQRGAK